jgi:hypothetical protein
MSAIPQNYEPPVSEGGQYTKFEDGTSTDLRILDTIVTGWQYFNRENKPVRSKTKWDKTPEDIGEGKFGKQDPKHIWVLTVYNYTTKQVELCTIPQVGIQRALLQLDSNTKWGDLLEYDITITRSKVGDKVEYSVTPNPKAPLSDEVAEAIKEAGTINVDAYFEGQNPFSN